MENDSIVEASLVGNTNKVRSLLKIGISANDQEETGSPPIVAASYNGHNDTIKVLLEYGAAIDLQDKEQWSALNKACVIGHLKTVQLLLEHGAKVDLKANKGQTALCIAIINGHLQIVKLLLDHGADIDSQNNLGGTPLLYATVRKHTEIVKLLLNHGAQANIGDKTGIYPLMVASEFGDLEAITCLLEHGAEVGAQNFQKSSALHHASAEGHSEAVTLLLEHGAEVDLQAGIAANHPRTALLLASARGHTEVVRILLGHGAEATYGLSVACIQNHAETVKVLLDHGAQMGKGRNEKLSILHVNCLQGNAEVVRELLEHGADVNSKGLPCLGRKSTLHHACAGGHTKTVQVLLDYGAEIDYMDNYGATPLCDARNIEVVNLLLDKGATVDPSPLSVAIYEENLEVVDILLGDLRKKGNTPSSKVLHIASTPSTSVKIKDLFQEHGFKLRDQLLTGFDVLAEHDASNSDTKLRLEPTACETTSLPSTAATPCTDRSPVKHEQLRKVEEIVDDTMEKLTALQVQDIRQSQQSLPMPSSEPTLPNVLRELIDQDSEWQNIGVLLNIPSARLKLIKNYYNRTRDCLREMILEWLKMNPPPTWQQLVEAMAPINQKTAESIHSKYC